MTFRLLNLLRYPRTAMVVLWIAVTTWFVMTEIIPRGVFGAPAGYDAVIDSGLMHRDSWMHIMDGDRIIGYSNSRIDIDEYTPGGRYLMFNKTEAKLPLFGVEHQTTIESRIALDTDLQLEEFDFRIDSADIQMRLQGQHIENEVFRIVFQGPIDLPPTRINLPRNAMILSPTAEIGLRRMRPGRKTTLQVFDPLTMQSTPLTVESLRHEQIENRGETHNVTLLAMQYQGITMHSWIAEDGTVLRQETPLGWILEACDPEDAMDFMRPSPSREPNHAGHD